MNPIQGPTTPLVPNQLVGATQSTNTQKSTQGPDFKSLLVEGLQEVQSMQQQAETAVEQMMTGGDVNPAEVLTAIQKADMSFKLMMQIRNKLVQAYQEIKEVRV